MTEMEFKLGSGPWKKLFSGTFQENEIGIYINPESVLLVVVYEKEGDEAKGAVVELYKVLASIGELEEFVATLPREVIVLTKHTKRETIKYFLLGSEPSYVAYEEGEFVGEVDTMLKRLETSAKMIKDVSKAYDLTLKELHDSTPKVRTAFFTQPLLVPVVSTAAHPAAAIPAAMAAGAQVAGITKGEVILGLTKDGTTVIEPLGMMMKTLIIGGDEKDRLHALHLMIEGALLSNVPAVIFDWEKKFSGLAEATKQRDELKRYKVELDPIGFPVRHFDAEKELVVDLNVTNIGGVLELFGAGSDAAVEAIKSAASAGKLKGIDELVKRVSETKPTENCSAYQILKAARIVRLIGMRYPRMFSGSNDIAEISKNWPKAIGRAGIIRMGEMDARIALMLVHNIVLGLLEYYRARGKSKTAFGTIALPDAERVLAAESTGILAKELSAALAELPMYGIGFVLTSGKKMDLRPDVITRVDAYVDVVRGNDVGVAMRDRKSYRVFLRPGLSRCVEMD